MDKPKQFSNKDTQRLNTILKYSSFLGIRKM